MDLVLAGPVFQESAQAKCVDVVWAAGGGGQRVGEGSVQEKVQLLYGGRNTPRKMCE